MPAKFLISILALGGLEMTKKCVASVLASANQDFGLLLTDNASGDGIPQYFDALAQAYPGIVSVLHNSENRGFIAPNNLAFDWAVDAGATYIVLLNNDAVVSPDWLDKLAEPLDAFDSAALSGPVNALCQLNTQMIGFAQVRFDYVEGSCLCAKVAVLLKVGGLFSDYLDFAYHEDSDLSLRVQRAGYSIHRVTFGFKHLTAQTSAKNPAVSALCRQSNTRNQKVMLKKWSHWNKTRRFDFPILVRRTGAVGDVLLTTPVIRAIKNLWPLCPIDVETAVPDIFKGNPHVRHAAKSIKHDGWTMVIDLDNAYERTPDRHVLLSYAEVADVDPGTVGAQTEVYFNLTDAPNLPEGRWCAMHVGATAWPGKNWPVTRFNEVAQRLRTDGWKVMLFGAPSREVIEVDSDRRGQSGIEAFAGMLAQCQLFIGLDSFPMHLAQALSVPTIGLFGITDPRCFMTGGSKAMAVCSDPTHPDTGRRNREPNITFIHSTDSVMRTISVDQVLKAVSEILT